MLTNSEIRALLDESREEIRIFERTSVKSSERMIDAIESLLERQAEVIKLAYPPRYGDLVELGGKLEAATDRLDKIRAILDPQPVALARKAPHDSRGWHPDDGA